MKTFTTYAEKKAKQFFNLLQGYTKGIRITAILILLLMGVNNAWAAYYILGPDGSWDQNATHQMVSSGITNWVYKNLTPSGQWTSFKVTDGSTWYGKNTNGENVTVGVEYTPTTSGGDNYCDFTTNYKNMSYYFFFNTSTKKLMVQPNYYLVGTCGASNQNWGQTQNATTYDATKGYFKWNTCTLTANTEYKFKLSGYGAWTYKYEDWNGVTIVNGTKLATDNDKNIRFKSTYTGTTVITFNPVTNEMVINCPSQISYNKGANGTGSISSGIKTYGINFTLSSSTFTRTGYTQDGWSTTDGGNKVYDLGGTYTTDKSITLYPHWTANKYTVTLNSQSATTAGTSSVTATYGAAMPQITPPTRTGYTFNGYFDATSGGTKYYNANGSSAKNWDKTSNTTLYAQWTPNTYTITYKDQGGSNFSGTHESGYPTTHTYGTATTLKTASKTGYTFEGWYKESACTNKVTSLGATAYTANITLYAKWTANTNTAYTVEHYKQLLDDTYSATPDETENLTGTTDASVTPAVKSYTGFTAPSTQTVTIKADGSTVVTYRYTRNKHTLTWNLDGGDITQAGTAAGKVAYGTTLTTPTVQKDGHTFTGWSPAVPETMPDNDVTCTAQWTANTYTVTLQHSTIAGYGSGGTSSVTATYGQAMPDIEPPTPADGYAFMGYWDGEYGSGTQYYDAKGESVCEWNQAKNTTLYAFFKKAEITSITLDKTLFESGETGYVTVTNHTIEPTPAGTLVVCWTLCYNNGTPVEGHNAIEDNGTVKFAIDGLSAGTYKIVASLRLNNCNGEELDRAEATFVVAGSYTVTIKYACDGDEIAGRKTQEGYPSTPTEATAPEIGGYNFVAWVLGDGIYTTDELTSKTIKYTANYDGYLTATYEKKKLIFLDLSKTFGKTEWTAPHIYLYSAEFWDNSKGTGATDPKCVAKGAMSPVPGTTGMWFYEYEGVKEQFKGYVAFTPTGKTGQEYFWDTEVIYRGDFSSGTPVFVPAEGQTANIKNDNNGNNAQYYNKGHWTKYMGGTGYTLKIYNRKEKDGRKELMSVPFTGSSLYLPFTAVVDLEAGQTFGYKIVRDNDKWYKNDDDNTMTVDNHENWPFIEDKNNGLACGIQTVAAGNHTFTLTLNATSGNFEVSVDYPVTVGDYRILYKDDTRSTYKPSDIKKAEELNPVTSFFIRPNSNPELKIQTAARVTNEGVTWYADNHIYFKPNANWKQNDAYFAARFNGTEEVWSVLNQNGDVYSCKIPNGANDVIFVRMNPNGSDATNNKLNWNNKWNQTGHLSLPKDKNEYTLNEGEWGNKLYLKPNSNWTQGDAWFAAYFFETGKEEKWLGMSDEDGDGVYVCDIPAENYKEVIFVRMNQDKHELNWDSKWDQSTNQTVPTNGNTLFTVKDGEWKNAGGSWSEREGSWSTISGSITDLTEELKEKLGEIKGDIKDAPDSVYTIHLSNNEGTLTIENVAFYTGNFYIRVDAAAGKWYDYKTNPDNLMTYSAFSESDANSFGEKFSHYKTKWCPRGTNVKFVIANDYSPCISDTLARDLVRASGEDYMTEGGELYQEDGGAKDPVYDRYSANIRFMWNRKTNKISRAYLASSSNDNRQFLVLKGCQEIKDENGNNLSGNGDNHGEFRALLQDTQNWIYERTFKVRPGTRVKLYACYADATVGPATAQYFRGAYDSNQCGSTENSVQILGGNGTEWEKIRVIYDFKTNRLMGAWVPESAIDSEQAIAADLMVIRRHQENATCVTLTNENSKLTDVKTAYGAMQFNRWTINNRGGADDLDVGHCTKLSGSHRVYDETITNQYHPVLPLAEQTSIYERGLYFISFPFDVHLSDVFGFGTYGTHWVISTYNGKRRAERGYFAEDCINEDCTNWDYIWDPTGFVMKANEGYLLSLDLDLMKHDNTSFWANNISQVELFFPSTAAVKSIEKTDYTMPALTEEYLCKINHNTPDGDRRVKDSYWRCIGVPSFADYDGSLTTDGNNTINWKADYTWKADNGAFPFLYEWNVTNNDLVVRSTNSYKFRATYAYLVQNGNQIYWKAVNTKPASIIARDQSENMSNYEWKIALLRNDAPADHTFIRMTDNESVTAAFDFHQDLSKEFNYGANIYTLVGYERLAANSMPCSDSTTIIPLGVSAQEAGDYTIAMPEGVENIGITLVDNETGIHTNLSAGQEYTLTLNKGICENRLFIEVSPIQHSTTDLEYTTEDTREQTTRKMLIDGMLYLIRDGVIYDAQGHKL